MPKSEKKEKICKKHSMPRQLSEVGYCMDCGGYPFGKYENAPIGAGAGKDLDCGEAEPTARAKTKQTHNPREEQTLMKKSVVSSENTAPTSSLTDEEIRIKWKSLHYEQHKEGATLYEIEEILPVKLARFAEQRGRDALLAKYGWKNETDLQNYIMAVTNKIAEPRTFTVSEEEKLKVAEALWKNDFGLSVNSPNRLIDEGESAVREYTKAATAALYVLKSLKSEAEVRIEQIEEIREKVEKMAGFNFTNVHVREKCAPDEKCMACMWDKAIKEAQAKK